MKNHHYISVLITLLMSASCCAFVLSSEYPCPCRISSIFAADLNGDGYKDGVSTIRCIDEPFHYTPNKGDGTFLLIEYSPWDKATRLSEYRALFVSDLDNDEDQDVAIVDYLSDTLSIYLNEEEFIDGKLVFIKGEVFELENISSGIPFPDIHVADLNRDTFQDIVIPYQGLDRFAYFENRGDGTFKDGIEYETGSNPLFLYTGDLNGDHCEDVVVSNHYDRTFSYFENKGDGTFKDRVDYDTGIYPEDIHVEDMDSDGDLDVVVIDGFFVSFDTYSTSSFSYFENKGDGTFEDPVYYYGEKEFKYIHIADFNEDGFNDVVACSPEEEGISYFENKGDGAFNEVVSYNYSGACITDMFTADLDKDGSVELLMGTKRRENEYSPNSYYVSIFKYGEIDPKDHEEDQIVEEEEDEYEYTPPSYDYEYEGHLNPPEIFEESEIDSWFPLRAKYDIGFRSTDFFADDFDGDWFPDIAVLVSRPTDFTYRKSILRFFENGDDHMFKRTVEYEADKNPRDIYASDFDQDGDSDVIVLNDDSFSYFENIGSWSFNKRREYSAGSSLNSIVAADFDNDGDSDVVITNSYSESWMSGSGSLLYFENKENGSFLDPIEYKDSNVQNAIFASDFDLDKDIDLVTTEKWSGNFSYFENKGDGVFGDKVSYNISSDYFTFQYISAADFNNDDAPDVITGDPPAYFENKGDGTFKDEPTYLRDSFGVKDVAIADFNNDGSMDIVMADSYVEAIIYFENKGDGTFYPERRIKTIQEPRYISVADFDMDGYKDIIVKSISGTGTYSLAYHRNDLKNRRKDFWTKNFSSENATLQNITPNETLVGSRVDILSKEIFVDTQINCSEIQQIFDDCEEISSLLGKPHGAKKQYRCENNTHIRVFDDMDMLRDYLKKNKEANLSFSDITLGDEVCLGHRDKHDPRSEPLRHLLYDYAKVDEYVNYDDFENVLNTLIDLESEVTIFEIEEHNLLILYPKSFLSVVGQEKKFSLIVLNKNEYPVDLIFGVGRIPTKFRDTILREEHSSKKVNLKSRSIERVDFRIEGLKSNYVTLSDTFSLYYPENSLDQLAMLTSFESIVNYMSLSITGTADKTWLETQLANNHLPFYIYVANNGNLEQYRRGGPTVVVIPGKGGKKTIDEGAFDRVIDMYNLWSTYEDLHNLLWGKSLSPVDSIFSEVQKKAGIIGYNEIEKLNTMFEEMGGGYDPIDSTDKIELREETPSQITDGEETHWEISIHNNFDPISEVQVIFCKPERIRGKTALNSYNCETKEIEKIINPGEEEELTFFFKVDKSMEDSRYYYQVKYKDSEGNDQNTEVIERVYDVYVMQNFFSDLIDGIGDALGDLWCSFFC